MDLLARREHTRLELERKLADREFDSTVIGDVLDRLQEDGLLDEDRFIESFVRTRVGKGHGPARIQAELGQRFKIKIEGGRMIEAEVVPLPFYDPDNQRQEL